MITEVPKTQWQEFFGNLSRDLDGWKTRVEILSDGVRARITSKEMSFHGLTARGNDQESTIELILSNGEENSKSHTIANPVRVSFKDSCISPDGLLDIEDGSGKETLIKFVEPSPVLMD